MFPVDYTHSNDINGKTFTSIIDHFHWSTGLEGSIVDAGVLYLPENTSDHCPIYCTLPANCLNKAPSKISSSYSNKPSWRKASLDDKKKFNLELAKKLEMLPTAHDSCTNVHCHDISHLHLCDDHLTNLLLSTAADCLPTSSGRKTNNGKRS